MLPHIIPFTWGSGAGGFQALEPQWVHNWNSRPERVYAPVSKPVLAQFGLYRDNANPTNDDFPRE